MKSDSQIKHDVEAELRWRPEIDDSEIGVSVNAGVVLLSGFAGTYFDKEQAEAAVKHVAGVTGVANDIEVRPPAGQPLTDPQIAHAAIDAIRESVGAASENIQVLVHHGLVTLEGHVEWHYLKDQAGETVRRIKGVMGISNAIVIQPRVSPTQVKEKIEAAFRRSAEIDADRISVDAHGGEVILRGRVRSWSERQEAQQTAALAPGVTHVRNEILVGSS